MVAPWGDCSSVGRRHKSLVLTLKRPLDREVSAEHHLLLSASDSGQPALTGTILLIITVVDVNDNAPAFNQSVYKTELLENSAMGTLVIKLEAIDLDEGINKEISYSLSNLVAPRIKEMFSIDPNNGELRVKGMVDFEESTAYDIQIEARDKGAYPVPGHCKVLIKVLDVNDNSPEMSLKSLSVPVAEDSPPGTVVALISISDRDSGANGQVSCSVTPSHFPFKLLSTFKNYYSLVVAEPLDREREAEYKLVVTAQDQGTPSLSTSSTLVVPIGDVNDNAPAFPQSSYTVFVKENNPPGAHIFTVSASDPDVAENSLISYWLDEKLWPLSSYISVHSESGKLYALQPLDYEEVKLLEFQVRAKDAGLPSLSALVVPIGDVNDNAPAFPQPSYTVFVKENNPPGAHIFTVSASDSDVAENALVSYWLDDKLWPLSSYISVHSESGKLYALQPLDYEEVKLLEFQVRAKDAGLPSLCGNVTVQVFVVDENDNAPEVSKAAEAPILLVVPVTAGHMVGKIHALDADSGYNAWLHYELHEGSSSSWRVGLYSGEISTTHSLEETEGVGNSMILLVLVKDHGKPVQSTTATLSISLVASTQAAQADAHLSRMGGSPNLFLLAIVVYVALRCQSQLEDGARYGPGTATLVCASEVGSWSYSQRHSRNLGCVAGEAGIKNDLMVFSPNIPVFAVNTGVGNAKELVPNLSGEVSHMEALRIFVTDALVFLSHLNAWHYTIGHHIKRQWGLIALCTSIYLSVLFLN
uniref:Cadherin domain-containing protein n=1 Tax=Podarcis muralis TaxID=64176 RepID=A0A670IMJ8_PODMU